MEDALIIGYDKAENEDMVALAICRIVNGKLVHIKTMLGEEAEAEYEMLTHRGTRI